MTEDINAKIVKLLTSQYLLANKLGLILDFHYNNGKFLIEYLNFFDNESDVVINYDNTLKNRIDFILSKLHMGSFKLYFTTRRKRLMNTCGIVKFPYLPNLSYLQLNIPQSICKYDISNCPKLDDVSYNYGVLDGYKPCILDTHKMDFYMSKLSCLDISMLNRPTELLLHNCDIKNGVIKSKTLESIKFLTTVIDGVLDLSNIHSLKTIIIDKKSACIQEQLIYPSNVNITII